MNYIGGPWSMGEWFNNITRFLYPLFGVLHVCTVLGCLHGASNRLLSTSWCNLSNSSLNLSNSAPVIAKVVDNVPLLSLVSWFPRNKTFSRSYALWRWIRPSVRLYSTACADFYTILRCSERFLDLLISLKACKAVLRTAREWYSVEGPSSGMPMSHF